MSIHHHKLDRRRWAAARRTALVRDGRRCQDCGRSGRLEVHHIVSLGNGGAKYDLSNLKSVCIGCHLCYNRKHRREKTQRPPTKWDRLVEELACAPA